MKQIRNIALSNLDTPQNISLHYNTEILSLVLKQGRPTLFVLEDTDEEMETKKIITAETLQPIHFEDVKYIGSYERWCGHLHVFIGG
jgi:hypothetical protein